MSEPLEMIVVHVVYAHTSAVPLEKVTRCPIAVHMESAEVTCGNDNEGVENMAMTTSSDPRVMAMIT